MNSKWWRKSHWFPRDTQLIWSPARGQDQRIGKWQLEGLESKLEKPIAWEVQEPEPGTWSLREMKSEPVSFVSLGLEPRTHSQCSGPKLRDCKGVKENSPKLRAWEDSAVPLEPISEEDWQLQHFFCSCSIRISSSCGSVAISGLLLGQGGRGDGQQKKEDSGDTRTPKEKFPTPGKHQIRSSRAQRGSAIEAHQGRHLSSRNCR